MEEMLIIVVVGAVLILGPLITFVLAIIAYVRSRRVTDLLQRVTELERRLAAVPRGAAPQPVQEQPAVSEAMPVAEPTAAVEPELVSAELVESSPGDERSVLSAATTEQTASPGWEMFIGQKAFGWLAVVLFVFAVTFFLRYAYQNNWIGPVGRVAIGELAGAALLIAGWHYSRAGWLRFSSMLTSAGIVVLYLATYSAFGFYRLLPQQQAGAFLALLVIESMVLAVIYRSSAVAFTAVLGGLATPLLLQSDHDAYSAFFLYLVVLNAGVLIALLLRTWVGVGTLAYVGTQGLFWMWYLGNYHPEKFNWALGFQVVLCAIYLLQSVVNSVVRERQANWEELARLVLNAIFGFVALRALLRYDYAMWLGSLALVLATVYALVARIALARKVGDGRLVLTSLAVSVGFIAWSFPIQADARWIAFGWSAMGLALWWFGWRVSAAPLRLMAAVLALAAVWRLLFFDLPLYTRNPFIPIFNRFALPSLGVAACLLIAVLRTPASQRPRPPYERMGIGLAGISGVLLIWLVLSIDCYGWFDSQIIGSLQPEVWHWRGQLALTVLWAVYATVLLCIGFYWQLARPRWVAMGLYGMAVLKLFFVDMANVQQLYRILAFLVLAIVLGFVARAYQRFR